MNKQPISITDPGLSSYLSRVSKIKMLSADEEYTYAIQWKECGDQQAAQHLIIAHLPLVIKVAYSYKNYGMSLIDLISEGNVGLMRALYKFDPYKGFRLATYAVWWIKAYITDYILNSWSLVKSGSISGRKKLFFSLRGLKQKLGITNNNFSKEHIDYISQTLHVSKDDVQYVNNMLENKDLSLEAPIHISDNGNDVTYANVLPYYNNPEEIASVKEEDTYCKNITAKALEVLNPRERFIIEQRFLIESPRTLSDIGTELNLSRERVRQIEVKALKKAKDYINSN